MLFIKDIKIYKDACVEKNDIYTKCDIEKLFSQNRKEIGAPIPGNYVKTYEARFPR